MSKLSLSREMLDRAESKRAYNRRLFSVVAPRYQAVTRVLSFDHDRAWKRRLIEHIPSSFAGLALDIACGSGDIALAISRRAPNATVLGLDLTPGMLAVAARRGAPGACRFIQGDMQRMPVSTGAAHLVTGGYALRNAPDLRKTLAEIARVLEPGGRALFLDFMRDESWFQPVRLYALKAWGSLWGLLFHGDPAVYRYIAHSLSTYPDRTKLARMCADAGVPVVSRTALFWGFAELIVCQRR
jgi:demethylmenaquinone methyltransferase/2-methoxy-6-polyprenyl-1,4-benzoquinol methylase